MNIDLTKCRWPAVEILQSGTSGWSDLMWEMRKGQRPLAAVASMPKKIRHYLDDKDDKESSDHFRKLADSGYTHVVLVFLPDLHSLDEKSISVATKPTGENLICAIGGKLTAI